MKFGSEHISIKLGWIYMTIKEEIVINIYFSKTDNGFLEEIQHWVTEMKDKMTISNISYNKDWTDTKTRVELSGTYRSKQ